MSILKKMSILHQKTKEIIKNHDSLYLILYQIRAYGLYLLNRISYYQLERKRFYKKLGYPLNLKNPQSYNEKIVWKKIYDRNPLLPVTADKYQVRSYIKKVLGEKKAREILIPLLYVTNQPETIPFDQLPHSFIIKLNHASGRKIIVREGHYHPEAIIRTCKRWLQTPYGLEKLEWAYRSIQRKITIEELLMEDGKIPKDMKFYMFHGKCKLVCIIFNRLNIPAMSIFNEKWKFLSLSGPSYSLGPKIQKPKNYENMLKLAEKLSKPFDHVRVDLYNINGRIYFGEITHYDSSGTGEYDPPSYDFALGKHWKIEQEYWKKINMIKSTFK